MAGVKGGGWEYGKQIRTLLRLRLSTLHLAPLHLRKAVKINQPITNILKINGGKFRN